MRPTPITLMIMAVSLLPAANSMAQGLGDAAKKEKERRERAAPNPGKTYTQDDLKGLPPVANEGSSKAATAGAATVQAEAAPQPAPQTADEAEKPAPDEKAWHSRVAAARAQVELTRNRYETVAPMNVAPDRPGVYVDFEGMKAAAKAEYEAAQKALDDLLEEARRANVPPGWLR